MKQLFENWRKFILSEKLMLKPGPNGWDKYCELVAAAYQSAPRFDPAAVASFGILSLPYVFFWHAVHLTFFVFSWSLKLLLIKLGTQEVSQYYYAKK